MKKDSDDRKRSHLRLVVNNPDKRKPGQFGSEDDFITLENLIAQRESLTPLFYQDMERLKGKAYQALERFLSASGWPYGLDPQHGQPLVLPALALCPSALAYGMLPQDELLVFIAEDAGGEGLCLSMEMIMPFYSDDEAVMEEALLYSPVLQYGSLFIEENHMDGLLDLIYRLGFPLYPPFPSARIMERIFSIVAREVDEALGGLSEYPST
ncbi:MAG: hypothetical protein PHD01_12850 [Geobacteraceae bacterium]|nr:hypothetical protein [Geobacteraceae bacterium]